MPIKKTPIIDINTGRIIKELKRRERVKPERTSTSELYDKGYLGCGGGRVGYYRKTYREMVRLFGKPDTGSGDGKVSTSWLFVFPGEEVDPPVLSVEGYKPCPLTIEFYDYKQTHLYSPELPTVEEFRYEYRDVPFNWHVGSNGTFNQVQRVLQDWKGITIKKERF